MDTPELNDYRAHLLDALDDQPRRAAEERPVFLQVLVNHERVGSINCAEPNPAFACTTKDRSIQHLEIRSESGVLLGGCVAPEAGQRNLRLPVGKGSLILSVQNHFDGGSLQLRYEGAPGWWSQVASAIGLPAGAPSTAAPKVPVWTMTTAFAQIVLAVGVVALLAERVPNWLGSEDRAHQLEEELAARQSTQEQIAQQIEVDVRALVQQAYTAGKNPAELFYTYAKMRGYAPQAAPAPQAAAQVQAFAEAQRQTQSLAPAGGPSNDGGMTLEAFAKMSEAEMAAMPKAKRDALMAKVMGG